ncbi:MAG: sensor histidine kinase, partial [Anaerolineae bacterium]
NGGTVENLENEGSPLTALGRIEVECQGLEAEAGSACISLQTFLESIAEGAVVVDDCGDILAANSRLTAIFGYEQAELVGRSVNLLLPPHLQGKHQSHIQRFFESPRQRPMGQGLNLMGRRKDGVEIFVEVGLSVLEMEAGTVVIGFVVDITDQKRAEIALNRSNRALQERNADLDAFAHTVAHDLKGPLSLILGYATLLQDKGRDFSVEEQGKYLGRIVQSGQKMSGIIDSLMLLASVRREEVDLEPLEMGPIVEEVLHRLERMCEEYEAEIARPDSWPCVLGYEPWIEQVWVNYLSNALKYGGDPPRVELGADLVQSGDYIRFWVRDNGRGLTAEERKRLFDTFVRLEQVRVDGHGLGLSIVKRIVGKMGGTVGVESEPGVGSVFSFTLRVA